MKIFWIRVFNFKNILMYLFVLKFLLSINTTFGDSRHLVKVTEWKCSKLAKRLTLKLLKIWRKSPRARSLKSSLKTSPKTITVAFLRCLPLQLLQQELFLVVSFLDTLLVLVVPHCREDFSHVFVTYCCRGNICRSYKHKYSLSLFFRFFINPRFAHCK